MKRYWVVGLALAALLSAAVLGSTGSAATPAQGTAGSHPAAAAKKRCKLVTKLVNGKKRKVKICSKAPTSASVLARQLAKQVRGARTPAARYSALLRVMRALHVPVFTPKGKVVVPGSKQLPRGFNLYDFELRTLAGSVGRGETITPSELAQELKDAGLRAGNEVVTPDQLRQALAAAAASAAKKPKAASSLVPLLVRDLGLGHGYDLARGLPNAAKLDTLQVILVALDLSLGRRQSAALRSPAADGGPCTGATAGDAAAWSSFLVGLGETTGKVVQVINVAAWPFHATLLANGIKVETRTPELQRTHFGPPVHAPDAGKELRFEISVRMQDDLGSLIVDCGSLVGIKVPQRGAVPDVPISWSNAENVLSKYGKISYDPANGKTGENGIAALVFKPNDEKIPAFGLEKEARGVLDGLALYQSAFGNLPGFIGQYMFPKYVTRSWSVLFHKPRGFKFEGLKAHFEGFFTPPPLSGYSTFDNELSGRVCGSDPYAAPWQIHTTYVARVYAFGRQVGPTITDEGTGPVMLVSGAEAHELVYEADWYWELQVNPELQANPVKMQVRAVPWPVAAGFVPSELRTSVAVEEDLSCPDDSG